MYVWKKAVQEEGAKALIKNFTDTDIVVQPRRIPIEVITQLVNQVLHDHGPTDPKKTYAIEDEIPPIGGMHQIKDVKSNERKK